MLAGITDQTQDAQAVLSVARQLVDDLGPTGSGYAWTQPVEGAIDMGPDVGAHRYHELSVREMREQRTKEEAARDKAVADRRSAEEARDQARSDHDALIALVLQAQDQRQKAEAARDKAKRELDEAEKANAKTEKDKAQAETRAQKLEDDIAARK